MQNRQMQNLGSTEHQGLYFWLPLEKTKNKTTWCFTFSLFWTIFLVTFRKKQRRLWWSAQVIEHSGHEVLSSNPRTTKTNKQANKHWDGRLAQAVESPASKWETLSSSPNTTKKEKKKIWGSEEEGENWSMIYMIHCKNLCNATMYSHLTQQ
jgi:hypothetical protein